ncbi:MAG: hypothetical protein ACOCXM_04705 [Myxococcota bacterium]
MIREKSVSTRPANPAMATAQHRTEVDVPEVVRNKLVACGQTVDPAQWEALPRLARERLTQAPARTAVERAAFRSLVRWLLSTFPPQNP